MYQPVVYILASERIGTLYVGVTSNLTKRTWLHKNDILDGFSNKYQTHKLVYYEIHSDMLAAIKREKQIKKWNRAWKVELIEKFNPEWNDQYPKIK